MADESSVRVLRRACEVLDCFSSDEPRLPIAVIRDRTGLPATTVARLVKTLVSENLLARDGDEYRLGLRVLVWGVPATAGSDLIAAATPVVEYLRDVTKESAGLYVRQGASRVAVVSVQSQHSIVYRGFVGQVLPLHAGAAGKVFMALDDDALSAALSEGLKVLTHATITDEHLLTRQLDDVRARGWAFAMEEREPGLNSLAAPVFNPSGRVIATLAIGGPSFRLTPEKADEFGDLVATAGLALSKRLGFTPAAGSGQPTSETTELV